VTVVHKLYELFSGASYSDDLNPLYVYEAKMSLFIRMAQSRAGCERLLEARLLPVLAQCDYLDARPETDQSFVGSSSMSFFDLSRSNY
jgi:Nuclear pore complex scaffold, nucleoporins 186/192/205